MCGGETIQKIRERLLENPDLTVVPDQAIDSVSADSFDLPFHIGPVYDILRHPDTITPLAVGIYGDWGTGKTSAMRWLDKRLAEWTEPKPPNKKDRKTKISLHTVWFYPWKRRNSES